MLASFFVPGGAARSGWTSYSPLATLADRSHLFNGQTFWIIGMVFLITSSLLGAVNFIATIIQLRAPGMTWMRLPFFVWAQFVTAFLLLLAFPPLEAAAVMQLADNLMGTSFFSPQRLDCVGGSALRLGRGQSAVVATSVLVFGTSGGLCVDPAGHGHGGRDHCEQYPQADLGL